MNASQAAPKTIDEYIAALPARVQELVRQIRATVRAAAPDAEETISYQMPTFKLNGTYLIYFAAYKQHIGLYPTPTGVAEFADALSAYAAGKGTLRFPLDKPLPLELIARVVQYRAAEIRAKSASKAPKRKQS